MQMEAHHYCNQANQDLAQCVLFDGNTAEARMMGIEYIISETLYNTLPAEEKAYWHPHNYEILSGQLRMPGLPDVAEKEALKGKMNSYGKTWHTWMRACTGSGRPVAVRATAPAMELQQGRRRYAGHGGRTRQALDLNTADERQDRQDLVALAKPQGGVEAMASLFRTAEPVQGVTDNGDPATRPVPTFGMKDGQSKPSGR